MNHNTTCHSTALTPTSKPVISGGEHLEARSPKLTPGGGRGPSGKKMPQSVSRLCFPFVTVSKRKDKNSLVSVSSTPSSTMSSLPLSKSFSPRRHKYSCAPTQFSPLSSKKISTAPKPQRHAYSNRGHSKEALEYVKSFWNDRRDGMKSGGNGFMTSTVARTVHPATALQTQRSSSAIVPGSLLAPKSEATHTTTSKDDESTTSVSIHPRRGDVCALRDPLCAEVDQLFGELGIWTTAKMVWMVELSVAAERSEKARQKDENRRRSSRLRVKLLWDRDVDVDDDDAFNSIDFSTRSTSVSSMSDDSMTLVGDEPPSCAEDAVDENCSDDGACMVKRGRKPLRAARISACSSATQSASPGHQLDFDKPDVDTRAFYQTQFEASKLGTDSYTTEWEILLRAHQFFSSLNAAMEPGQTTSSTN